jgi:hypothetical protein
MLNVILPSVIMLSVVVPIFFVSNLFEGSPVRFPDCDVAAANSGRNSDLILFFNYTTAKIALS